MASITEDEKQHPSATKPPQECHSSASTINPVVLPSTPPPSKDTTKTKDVSPLEQPQYPEGLQLFCIIAGLMCAIFCLGLDRSILSTAIPKITTEFDSLDDIGWYGSSYMLTTCAFQLMFGKLFAVLPTRRVFLSSLALFELGSVVCAAAPNSTALIIGRAIAGVGCAGLLAGALVIVARALPLHKRPLVTGLVGGVSGIAQIVAPTLGGVLADRASWRWCFWINLPLGAVSGVVVFFLVKLPTPTPPTKKEGEKGGIMGLLAKLDLLGTAIFMPSIVSLLLALQWGGATYAWSNWRIILLLCLFGVLFLVWLYVQYARGDLATLPLRIMRQRSIASAVVFCIGTGGCLFIIIYFVPIWFQAVKDTSAEQSGVNFLASAVPLSLTSIVIGALTSKIGYYVPQMICCPIVTATAAGLIYRYDLETSTAYWLGTLIMFGIGLGLGMQMSLTAAQTVLQGPDIALGTSTIVLAQALSGAVFLSVCENILRTTLLRELHNRVPDVNPADVLGHGASGLKAAMLEKYGEATARAILVAYNEAIRRCFLVCVILACISLLGALGMEWKSVKERKQTSPTAVEGEKKAGES